MNIENLIGYAAIFFGIIGSWGLYRQTRLIWKSKSAESVSGVWVIIFLAMFASFLIYGSQHGSFPMKFQGWLRVIFSVPVTVGFYLYGKHTWKHNVLAIICVILLVTMEWREFSSVIFLGFSFAGIGSSFLQAYTIFKNRSRGKVAVELQIIYLSAITCWLVYAILRKDTPLLAVSIGFILSYSSTIVMWVKYPGLRISQHQLAS